MIQDAIESIPSVLDAKIGGKRKEQVDVIIDVRSLEGYNLQLEEIINIVNQNIYFFFFFNYFFKIYFNAFF